MQKSIFLLLAIYLLIPMAFANNHEYEVYFFNGNNGNNPGKAMTGMKKGIDDFAKDRQISIKSTLANHNDYKELCEDLTNKHKENIIPPHIILVGHSYGASGSVRLSHCLADNDVPVKLMLQIDLIPMPSFKLKSYWIPHNVEMMTNIYQRVDSVFKGNYGFVRVKSSLSEEKQYKKYRGRKVESLDGENSQKNIYNFKIKGYATIPLLDFIGNAVESAPHTVIDNHFSPVLLAIMKYTMANNGQVPNLSLAFNDENTKSFFEKNTSRRSSKLYKKTPSTRMTFHKKNIDAWAQFIYPE